MVYRVYKGVLEFFRNEVSLLIVSRYSAYCTLWLGFLGLARGSLVGKEKVSLQPGGLHLNLRSSFFSFHRVTGGLGASAIRME